MIKIILKTQKSTRSRIFNLLHIKTSKKKFVKRLKKVKIIFSLKRILIFISLTQKYFEKFLSKKNVLKFQVNNLEMKNVKHEKNFVKNENWYFCESSKMLIEVNEVIQAVILLNLRAKMNVMIKTFLNCVELNFHFNSRLQLISHIEHYKIFLEICSNVKINVNELRIYHHVFVTNKMNHFFILKQFFFTFVSINYNYREHKVYAFILNFELIKSVIFKILNR